MSFIYDMVDTWNNGATTFTAFKMNVTDTASAAGSLLMDLQVGGVSQEKTDKSGNKTLTGTLRTSAGTPANVALGAYSNSGLAFPDTATTYVVAGSQEFQFNNSAGLVNGSTGYYGFSASVSPGTTSADTRLYRDAANTLAQRNGTAAQAFRAYTSFTDGANYERFGVNTAAGVTTLAAESAGTGSANIDLALSPLGTGRIKVANGMTANGTVATAMSSVGPTGSNTTVQEWLAIKNSAGTVRYIPCF